MKQARNAWSRIPSRFRPWLLVAIAGGVLGGLDAAGFFAALERTTLDSRFRLRAQLTPAPVASDELVLVAIGEDDLAYQGRWPWRRSVHGDLLTLLAAMGPGVVTFDVTFSESTAANETDPGVVQAAQEDDAYLAEAASALPVVVGAMLQSGRDAGGTGAGFGAEALPRVTGNLHALPGRGGPLLPYPALAKVATEGFVNAPPEPDGVHRRLPLVVRSGEEVHASLVTATLMRHWKVKADDVVVKIGRALEFHREDGIVRVPMDRRGTLRVNFRSISALEKTHVLPYIPTFRALIAHLTEGQPWPQDRPHPGGKIVLVGVTAEGIDVGATPMRAVTPLPYLHAQAIENIVRGDFLRIAPWWLVLPGWIAVTGLVLGMVGRAPILRAILVPAAVAFLFVVVSLLAFVTASLDLPLVWTIGGFALVQYGSLLQRWYLDHAARLRTEAQLRAAGEIQQGMLPDPASILRGHEEKVDLAAFLEPAKENSGDFYDVFWITDRRLCFLVGDVCDKGLEASTFMVMAKTMIHALANPDLHDVITRANTALADQNAKGMFATIVMVIVDTETGEMVYTTPGHHGPLVVAAEGGTVEALAATEDFAVGPLGGIDYRVLEHRLRPGETLFLCTDGVTEAFNESEEEFGMERAKAVLATCTPSESCAEWLEAMHGEIADFAGKHPQSDDITMMAFRMRPD